MDPEGEGDAVTAGERPCKRRAIMQPAVELLVVASATRLSFLTTSSLRCLYRHVSATSFDCFGLPDPWLTG